MMKKSSLARIFIEIVRCLICHTETMGNKGSSMYEAARAFALEPPCEDYGMPTTGLSNGKRIHPVVMDAKACHEI